MKGLIYSVILATILSVLIGCKTQPNYVPVESSQKGKEYIDRWHRDSIFLYKNKYVYQKGDTVFIVDSVVHYKDRYLRDSVFITDTVRIEVPYPVVETKEVNRLKNWQIILMILGGVAIGYIGFKLIRYFRF